MIMILLLLLRTTEYLVHGVRRTLVQSPAKPGPPSAALDFRYSKF